MKGIAGTYEYKVNVHTKEGGTFIISVQSWDLVGAIEIIRNMEAEDNLRLHKDFDCHIKDCEILSIHKKGTWVRLE